MIERVVENWLTNSNERGFEIPFCQLLCSNGHKVVHLSSHGQMEQGKDIVTIDPKGKPCAYQLKSGNISLEVWRNIRGEVRELLEYPIDHPSVPSHKNYQAYLVTNGTLADPVRRAIEDGNRDPRNKRFPRLQTIVRGELLKDFINLHGQYLPKEPDDFRQLLELFLKDGSSIFPKKMFAEFLETILPLSQRSKPQISKSEASRSIASSVLLTSYILSSFFQKENHVAIIEAWTLLGAHILAVAERYSLSQKYWCDSFKLIKHGLEAACNSLQNEILRKEYFFEGEGFGEGIVHKPRMTMLLGFLSAYQLYRKISGDSNEYQIVEFVEKHISEVGLWGESAIPLFLSIFWFLEGQGKCIAAESIIFAVINAIVKRNGPGSSQGLPSPYYQVEDCLLKYAPFSEKDPSGEDFQGHSYFLQSLIALMARRIRRKSISFYWKEITHIQFCEIIPDNRWTTYLWSVEKGILKSIFPNQPESWVSLRKYSQTIDEHRIPHPFKEFPEFHIFFLICYPHRVTPDLVKFLDQYIP